MNQYIIAVLGGTNSGQEYHGWFSTEKTDRILDGDTLDETLKNFKEHENLKAAIPIFIWKVE